MKHKEKNAFKSFIIYFKENIFFKLHKHKINLGVHKHNIIIIIVITIIKMLILLTVRQRVHSNYIAITWCTNFNYKI